MNPRSRTIPVKFFLYLICLLGGQLPEAQTQTIITDRPDQTESSSTIEKGSLQIESGILLQVTENSGASLRQLLAPTTLFRVGLTEHIELRVLNQFENIALQNSEFSYSGLSDMEVGAKIQLYRKPEGKTEVALLTHAILPTGSEQLTIDAYGTINKLCISHPVNDKIGVGYNLGYNYFGEGSGDLTYSLAIGFGITDKLAVYIEPYGDIVEMEDLQASFDAGLTYLTTDQLQLDFSFGTGINHTMNYISAGFSWNIKDGR